ncbi:MAG: response regulator [Lachnospiraceae bacterium]|nr:response regulator [Lachnospiraceae bacterium]
MRELKIKRWKNRLGILLILLLFFGAVAGITAKFLSDRLRNTACEHYQLLANATAETINSWLSAKMEIIENQRASLETIDRFDPEFLTFYLERAVIGRQDFDEICDLYFIDTQGGLATANGFDTDYDLRSREYYQSVLDTREIFFTAPYRDVSTGSFVMTASVSCRRQDGSLAGVLAIDLYIDAFLEIVDTSLVPDNSYLFLIDSYYGMALHPYEAFGYVDDLPQEMAALQDGIYLELEQTISSETYDMVALSDYDGVVRNMFMSPIRSCKWCVVAAVSDDVLKGPERILIAYIMVALLLILISGMLWTFFGTRKMMKELSLAMEATDAANRSKSDFLANMSHEIRTPINAVLGMNEMILRESKEPETISYAENVDSAGKNLLSIINDILDFSKIESGKMEIVEAPYRLSSVLNDVSNMILFRAKDKDLAFDVFVDQNLPDHLSGDEVRIRQVITNLLNNAVKYTLKGSVKLTVEERAVSGEEDSVNLTAIVEDTGIGIKKEDMDKLFGKFERMDLNRNKTVEGTGLGLAITKNLVEMMGGIIAVDSVYGEGSRFTVSIPQKIVSREPIGDFRESFRQSTRESGSYHESFHAPEAEILVVDDTEMNLMVIRGLLKKTQMQVTTASGGKEAIALVEQKSFDLILMDQRMPEMDGAEAQKRIRALPDESTDSLPIICLTADAVQGARDRYLEQGFTDYLSKPVESAALEEMLLRYLPEEKIIRSERSEQENADGGATKARRAEQATVAEEAPLEAVSAEEARRLEKELTPKLLQAYRALGEAMKPFFGETAAEDLSLPEIDPEELTEFYEAVSELSAIYDADGIRRLLRQMEGYRLPEAEKERFARVRKCAGSSDWEGLRAACSAAPGEEAGKT